MTIKIWVLQAAKYAGLFALVRNVTRKRPRILCYHAGSIGDERFYNPKLFCTRAQLEQRLRWLRRHGFTPATLDQIVAGVPRAAGTPVAITLDDGWYSTYRDLLPVLAEYGYEPVLYLHSSAYEAGAPIAAVALRYLLWKAGARQCVLAGCSAAVDGSWNLADSRQRQRLCVAAEEWLRGIASADLATALERFASGLGIPAAELDLASRRFSYMTPDELRQAAAAGCRIELHGHEHTYETGQLQANIRNIEANRERIEAAGLPHPTHYCYPSGNFDSQAPDVMRAAGVATATTCLPGLVDMRKPDARYYLPRFLDGGDVSMIEFEAEMSGILQLLRQLTRGVRRAGGALRPSTA